MGGYCHPQGQASPVLKSWLELEAGAGRALLLLPMAPLLQLLLVPLALLLPLLRLPSLPLPPVLEAATVVLKAPARPALREGRIGRSVIAVGAIEVPR